MSIKLFIKCKICNFECNNWYGFSNHITKFHKLSSKEYYDKYLKVENEDICLICKNKTNFINISHGYRHYCSAKCSMTDEKTKNKIKETCLNKYGYESASQSTEVKIKQEKTCYEKYGCKSSLQNNTVKLKRKNNFLLNHGCNSPSQLDYIKERKKDTLVEHYGVEYYSQTKTWKDIIKNQTLQKYKNYINSGIVLDYNNDCTLYYCNKCKNTININRELFISRLYKNIDVCINCNPIEKFYSVGEKEVVEFIKSIYFNNIIENDRIILEGKEIDIYLPDIKLAFEYDGTYYHADARFYKNTDFIKKRNMYAIDIWNKDKEKIELCKNKGIKLIRIKEYDWYCNDIETKNLIKEYINEQI